MNENRSVHVIAEAGSNHCGSLETAKRLVDLAKRAGADSYKIQIINPDDLYLPGKYEFGHYDIEEVRSMRRRFMMTDPQHSDLANYCNVSGIPFSASVFDQQGLELLTSLNPPYIKIASTDLNNLRFLRQVAKKGFRIILSTGMSSLGDIEKSVVDITHQGFSDLVLMHCVSVYPAPLKRMNLRFLTTLQHAFGFPVALSDHTEGSLAAVMAVALGACYVEKHFTLDRTMEGFDHAHASEGDEFVRYVADIRAAEEAMTRPLSKIGEAEIHTSKRARRSIYAARDLIAGTTIKDEDVLIVRPENQMSADQIDLVVGYRLNHDIPAFSPVTPSILTK